MELVAGLAVDIEKGSAVPIYAQLRDQIRLLIHRGALVPGDMMPTVRALAVDLGINANTVARVYRDLQSEGLLRLERGIGTSVMAPPSDRTVHDKDFQALGWAGFPLDERTSLLRADSTAIGLLPHCRHNHATVMSRPGLPDSSVYCINYIIQYLIRSKSPK